MLSRRHDDNDDHIKHNIYIYIFACNIYTYISERHGDLSKAVF